MKHFKTLSNYIEYIKFPKPEHPQLSVLTLDSEILSVARRESQPITNNCYTISLKRVSKGNLRYGRTQYDFTNGAMAFISPRQILEWDSETQMEDSGFIITFHEDFIRGTQLSQKIKTYGFFSYAVHEALHFSPKEEEIILSIFDTIKAEYHNNQDEFSKDIIISQLDTLLKFADRFYKRQFINRKEISTLLLDKFKFELKQYFESKTMNGLPNIEQIADKLNVSQRYLTDTLKRETGKSAKEHINLFIIEKAKDKLLGTSETISQIAFDLGFEYPQHFSKMFKKQTNLSPKAYRNMN
jgi:AraC-like DNA-binding protein